MHGLRHHSKRWLAGVIVTSIGLGLVTVGAGLFGYHILDGTVHARRFLTHAMNPWGKTT